MIAVGLLAAGDETGFMEHERRWRSVVDRYGLSWLGATQAIAVGIVETSVGNADSSERRLRGARDVLVSMGDIWWVGALDGGICSSVAAQGQPTRFLPLADAFDASTVVPDRQMLVRRSVLRSRALNHRAAVADAEAVARHALELAESTDLVLDHADALLALADALEPQGRLEEAVAAREEAATRLRAKGNVAAAARVMR